MLSYSVKYSRKSKFKHQRTYLAEAYAKYKLYG